MTKTIFKATVSAVLFLAVAGANLSAQTKHRKDYKDPANIEKTVQDEKNLPPKENNQLVTVTGKIKVISKGNSKFISITTGSKKTYIINVDERSRTFFERLPGNKENFTAENVVTAESLLDSDGKTVTLSGILNRKCNVFSVVKSGSIPKRPIEGLVDAK